MEQSEKNLSELVDIRDVVIDKSLPLEERVRSYVEQIKDPYRFKVGDVVVRVSYADKDKSLTDSFTSMIASIIAMRILSVTAGFSRLSVL